MKYDGRIHIFATVSRLQAFSKSQLKFVYYIIDNYGYDGPIVVDNHRNAIIDTWFEVGRELGYQIFDPNGFQQEGLF